MRRRAGCMPILEAIPTTIGIINATVPVLLTNAPMTDVTITTSRKSAVSLPPANFIIRPPTAFAKPVCIMAPPTTKSPTIIITTVDEKPEKASTGVRIPNKSKAESAQSATMSERSLPIANINTVRTNIMRVTVIAVFYRYY